MKPTRASALALARDGGDRSPASHGGVFRRRRSAAGLVLGMLLGATIATPVLAVQPGRTWIGEETILYDGYCSFPVLLEDSHASVKELAFPPDATGAQRLIYAGVFQSTLTNLDTGATTEVVIGSRVTYRFLADGTGRADASGRVLYYYTAEEAGVSELGQGLFLGAGRGFEEYDENGLTRAGFTGRATDLCEVLGG
jgi:hypothetical protein